MILLVVLLFTAGMCACAASLVSAPAASLIRALARRATRRHRAQDDLLPADWWEQFEAAFRNYTSRGWQAAREAERHL